jgi:hypothetical protein
MKSEPLGKGTKEVQGLFYIYRIVLQWRLGAYSGAHPSGRHSRVRRCGLGGGFVIMPAISPTWWITTIFFKSALFSLLRRSLLWWRRCHADAFTWLPDSLLLIYATLPPFFLFVFSFLPLSVHLCPLGCPLTLERVVTLASATMHVALSKQRPKNLNGASHF